MTKKKVVEDTRPQWEIDREARELEYNNAVDLLLPNQIETLKFVMKTIQDSDFECHERYELGVDTMKAIDTAEWRLRTSFPELYEHIHNDRMGV
jgi:hypothetical protein